VVVKPCLWLATPGRAFVASRDVTVLRALGKRSALLGPFTGVKRLGIRSCGGSPRYASYLTLVGSRKARQRISLRPKWRA
jgi:hypothetical protein